MTLVERLRQKYDIYPDAIRSLSGVYILGISENLVL